LSVIIETSVRGRTKKRMIPLAGKEEHNVSL
jgi:hypothetical protein